MLGSWPRWDKGKLKEDHRRPMPQTMGDCQGTLGPYASHMTAKVQEEEEANAKNERVREGGKWREREKRRE